MDDFNVRYENTSTTIADMDRIRRFLVYGRDDGVYFANNIDIRQVLCVHARCIDRMIANGRGREVVELIKTVSTEGRAAKQTPILFALAVCACCNDKKTKDAAFRSLPDICRIPTHLFQFVRFITYRDWRRSGGWGRAPKRAISEWYNQEKFVHNPMKLLRLGTKYRRRHSFTHRDLIRLAHIKPKTKHLEFAIRYLVKGLQDVKCYEDPDGIINQAKKFVFAVEEAKKYTIGDVTRLLELITENQLTWEHIPTELLKSTDVWRNLLYQLPVAALIRNLGRLSKMQLLQHGSFEEQHVTERLLDDARLRAARIHPLTLLTAWNTYKRGESATSRNPMIWEVNENIANVLESAFYRSFSASEGTGKRILFAVDGTYEMMQPVNGMPLVFARSAAVAIALFMSKIENFIEFILVSDEVSQIHINPTDNLESGSAKFSTACGANFSTDSWKPIKWALQNNKCYDAIVFCTASAGRVPNQGPEAMRQYRQHTGILNSRLIVIAMTSKENVMVDENDLDMLSVVGFDSHAMNVVLDFIRWQ